MRILLRQQRTGLYLQLPGKWTGDRETASTFDTSADAIDWAHQHQIADCEIVMAFPDPRFDFVSLRLTRPTQAPLPPTPETLRNIEPKRDDLPQSADSLPNN